MKKNRPAPKSIRFTDELTRLLGAALKKAGIRKTTTGWFPLLLKVLLINYVGEK